MKGYRSATSVREVLHSSHHEGFVIKTPLELHSTIYFFIFYMCYSDDSVCVNISLRQQ